MKMSSMLVVPVLLLALTCHAQQPPQRPRTMEIKSDFDPATLAPSQSLRDVIASQPLPFTGRTAKLKIPAGAFRIVDVKQ